MNKWVRSSDFFECKKPRRYNPEYTSQETKLRISMRKGARNNYKKQNGFYTFLKNLLDGKSKVK